jgi:hypothetical protein
MSHDLRSVAGQALGSGSEPGQFFRVNITLPFEQHNDLPGSNFVVEARGYSPHERA